MTSGIHITTETDKTLHTLLPAQHVLVLTDQHVAQACLPHLPHIQHLPACIIPSGEESKNLQTVESVWNFLYQHQATRHSLLLCIGGGMVGDLGGFAASTYMRGMTHINVATTLLAAVDASVGGKTGINHLGLKNLIGTYCAPQAVVIGLDMMRTLETEEWLSGYAEMLKHALLDGEDLLRQTLSIDIDHKDDRLLTSLIRRNLDVKQHYTTLDPTEQGPRKALNLGHTVGHAIEELSLNSNRPLRHGHAVAYGLVAELYLSHALLGLPSATVSQMRSVVRELYGPFDCPCRQMEEAIRLMTHDKKSLNGELNFTLLRRIGEPVINQTAAPQLVEEALTYL
ncbi:MAG: 3-dehydroquinate synthase [Paludibacteraceae bacterium]|nr:3-dehydroquinate synthase [Paludibacteraceae bacterium]